MYIGHVIQSRYVCNCTLLRSLALILSIFQVSFMIHHCHHHRGSIWLQMAKMDRLQNITVALNCTKSIFTKWNFTRVVIILHKRCVTDITETVHSCPVCDKNCTWSDNGFYDFLINHKRRMRLPKAERIDIKCNASTDSSAICCKHL